MGQFVAESLEVHQHQTVHYRRFEHWKNLWEESEDPSNGLPGDGIESILPAGPVGTALENVLRQAFERSFQEMGIY